MKKTAVDWLFEKMTEKGTNAYWDMRFKKAKQMEKDEIEKAFTEGYFTESWNLKSGEEYYKETYGKNA